jgi:hypothetical protein
MTPKELADNESEIKIDNDDVLMILIDGGDAWDYYAPQRLKDKWTYFKKGKNYVHLVLDKNGDNYYVITSSVNFWNHTVVDSNDRYVSILDVADKYPSIESELLDFFEVDTIYSVLKRIKNGKKYDRWDLMRIDKNISGIEFNQRLPGKSMIKLSFDAGNFIKYFDVGDENEYVITAIYSYGEYNFTNYDRIWDDWNEGYFYNNFSSLNESLIKEIVSFISPDILSLEEQNEDKFRQKVLKVLNNEFGGQCHNIMREYVNLGNEKANEIIQQEIEQDFSDVFNDIGIIEGKLGEVYYTTVNVLLSLYEQNNNKTATIAELIKKLAENTNVKTPYYWEIGNDEVYLIGEYDRIFQEYAESELNDMLDYIKNNPEEFEKIISFGKKLNNLKKMGYEIGKTYPLPYDNKKQFKIIEINKDTEKIILYYFSGVKDAEKRSLSLEEFYNFLNTPELFENFIRKFKK